MDARRCSSAHIPSADRGTQPLVAPCTLPQPARRGCSSGTPNPSGSTDAAFPVTRCC